MVSEPRRPVSDDMPDQFWDSLVHSVACDELTRGILALVQTESQAKVLVQRLARQNWAELLARKVPGLSRQMALAYCEEGRCSMCECLVPKAMLRESVYPGSKYGMLCPECEHLASERYLRVCEACGSEFIERYGRSYAICPSCLNRRWTYQAQVVSANNSRTRLLGLDTTLTPNEWFRTLRAFAWRCAYCGRDAGLVLDHLIPVAKGGGTTSQNCVPACAVCNGSKLDKSPTEWLGADTYERVVATLARTHTLEEATMSSYQKPVKARLARVNCCAECPFGWYAENDKEFACNSMVDADGAERLAGPGDTIPDWCPLPEAEEATDGAA